MAEISWTQEAEKWLREIHDYIAEDNPAAAVRTVEGIYQKTQLRRSGSRLTLRSKLHIEPHLV